MTAMKLEKPYVIGLMSGTSLDGADAALVSFEKEQPELIDFLFVPMPAVLKQKILDCCSIEKSNIALTCSLNVELGHYFANATLSLCRQAGVQRERVLCIASHGQTVYHIPQTEGEWLASTLQLGEPAVIAYETGLPVVSSFRAMDMAAGGRGAPLVPYVDFLLFKCGENRALQNIGGIGNVTVLPANCAAEKVIAFDTGPGNMVIDSFAQHLFHIQYDEDGRLAARGKPNEKVLAAWMAEPFFSLPPPKATGRELFGEQFIQTALEAFPNVLPHDWLATAAMFTAMSISRSYKDFVFPLCPVSEVIVSGGGSYNLTLLNDIRAQLPECRVLRQEDLGFRSDAKEAMAFAVLGYETMMGRPGNLPSATGAARPVILGNITPAPFFEDP
jgi:anhydro-N-acetylmuramic acid kinase